jgi:hypothetical protein
MILQYEDTNEFIPVDPDSLVIGAEYVIPSKLMIPGSKKVWATVELVEFALAPGGVKCAGILYKNHPVTQDSRCSLDRLHTLVEGTCTPLGEIASKKEKRAATKVAKRQVKDMHLLF